MNYTQKVLSIIRKVPKGRVCTYGGVAVLAGNPRGALQVARILHSMSKKEHLPWHRIINSKGKIVIRNPEGYKRQQELLESEGIPVSNSGTVDLERFLWNGTTS